MGEDFIFEDDWIEYFSIRDSLSIYSSDPKMTVRWGWHFNWAKNNFYSSLKSILMKSHRWTCYFDLSRIWINDDVEEENKHKQSSVQQLTLPDFQSVYSHRRRLFFLFVKNFLIGRLSTCLIWNPRLSCRDIRTRAWAQNCSSSSSILSLSFHYWYNTRIFINKNHFLELSSSSSSFR